MARGRNRQHWRKRIERENRAWMVREIMRNLERAFEGWDDEAPPVRVVDKGWLRLDVAIPVHTICINFGFRYGDPEAFSRYETGG